MSQRLPRRLEDLPPRHRAEAERQLAKNNEHCPRCDLFGGEFYTDPNCIVCRGKGWVNDSEKFRTTVKRARVMRMVNESLGTVGSPQLLAPGKGLQATGCKRLCAQPEAGDAQPDRSRVSTDEEKLNKTERAFLSWLRIQHVSCLHIQAQTLKLAHDCRLTVDFTYFDTATFRFQFVDVKGFQREDALIKMKVAARMFPEFDFHIVKKTASGWDFKLVKP